MCCCSVLPPNVAGGQDASSSVSSVVNTIVLGYIEHVLKVPRVFYGFDIPDVFR